MCLDLRTFADNPIILTIEPDCIKNSFMYGLYNLK
jgi:hypothetical protein